MPKHPLGILLLVSLSLTAACQKDASQGEEPIARADQPVATSTGEPAGARAGTPPATTPEDTVSEQETVTYDDAIFEIDRVAGGKRFQGSWLLLPGGQELLLSYRPMPEHFDLLGKKVVATGKHYTNPPNIQSIGADHFELHSIEAAPGVKPLSPKPTSLPAPPIVRDEKSFRGMFRRWVQLRAKLIGESEGNDKEDSWIEVVLELEDGTKIHANFYKLTYEREFAKLEGKQISTTGRAWSEKLERWTPDKLMEPATLDDDPLDEKKSENEENQKPEKLILGGNISLCEGDVDGCGMASNATKPGMKKAIPKKINE